MSSTSAEGPLEVKITGAGHPVTGRMKLPCVFGTRDSVVPKFYVEDPAAVTLGELPDGKTGLAVKEMGGWTSVYISAPNIPPALLRGIAETAGVHVYFDQDQVLYADEHFVSIHTNREVEGILRLPEKADLYDVYSEKFISRSNAEVHLKLPANTTVMYQLK
jgi:hypothetical protein